MVHLNLKLENVFYWIKLSKYLGETISCSSNFGGASFAAEYVGFIWF